ncbi:MAG: 23S rRNA (adenine(2503)-C(2))-methyltransferase RlmN [Terriglobia bacterium]
MPLDLLGRTQGELRRLAADWGEPAYRGSQLYHALYAQRRRDFAGITNLPRSLRARLAEEATLGLPSIEQKHTSMDATIRYVLRLVDGQSIETVWMPEAARQTVCLSTQAGCAVECHFCATAQLGLLRNLSAGEIVGQVLVALEDNRNHLKPQTNIVLMGQGEPLLNYDSVQQAVRLLADPNGMKIPLRKITLSTVGIVPGIRRLAEEEIRPKLAVSLNATTDEVRTAIMPINKKHPLGALLAACRDYPLRPRERITFEYVLLGGLNDAREDALRLVRLLAGLRAKVNLLPWNPVPGLSYRAPEESAVVEFQKILSDRGLLAFIRRSRGQDVFAACGQLALLASSSGTETQAAASA